MISTRFEIPGLSGERTTSRPEAVTALLNFFRIVSGGARTSTVPWAVPPVVDIFFSGSWGPRLLALDEDGRALRVEAGGEEERGKRERRLAELGRVELDRDRVQVDDAEEGVALLLRRDVLADRADVVAEVLGAGGLDAGEDAHGDRRRC